MDQKELGTVCEAPLNGQTANSLKLYQKAKEFLDVSLVPTGDDPEYGCAISVNMLSLRTFGTQIGGGTSTYNLLQDLIISPLYQEVTELESQAGDVIIDATGTSTIPNSPIPNGHVGIIGYYGIMSNNSSNGLWQENYTHLTWKQRYEKEGGYPTRYFRHR